MLLAVGSRGRAHVGEGEIAGFNRGDPVRVKPEPAERAVSCPRPRPIAPVIHPDVEGRPHRSDGERVRDIGGERLTPVAVGERLPRQVQQLS